MFLYNIHSKMEKGTFRNDVTQQGGGGGGRKGDPQFCEARLNGES